MHLTDFIKEKNIEKSNFLVDKDFLLNFEKSCEVVIGKELSSYILEYGYLAFEYIEFYGINSKQKMNSDMIIETKYLHEYYTKTHGLIAFENQGEGVFLLVDKDDFVYTFNAATQTLYSLKQTLFNYILERFNSI